MFESFFPVLDFTRVNFCSDLFDFADGISASEVNVSRGPWCMVKTKQ